VNPNAVFKILYLSKGKCCIYKISNLSLLGFFSFLRAVACCFVYDGGVDGGTGLFNRVKWARLSGQAALQSSRTMPNNNGDRCHYSMKICM